MCLMLERLHPSNPSVWVDIQLSTFANMFTLNLYIGLDGPPGSVTCWWIEEFLNNNDDEKDHRTMLLIKDTNTYPTEGSLKALLFIFYIHGFSWRFMERYLMEGFDEKPDQIIKWGWWMSHGNPNSLVNLWWHCKLMA